MTWAVAAKPLLMISSGIVLTNTLDYNNPLGESLSTNQYKGTSVAWLRPEGYAEPIYSKLPWHVLSCREKMPRQLPGKPGTWFDKL